eukprot:1841993-Pyramimonas_sp.AAC.1
MHRGLRQIPMGIRNQTSPSTSSAVDSTRSAVNLTRAAVDSPRSAANLQVWMGRSVPAAGAA